MAEITQERVLDALGNPVRRAILRRLAGGPRSVGELASDLPVSRPAVSKHLQILQTAALVEHDREGTRHVFRLDARGFGAMREFVDAFWDEGLRRFVATAEHPPSEPQ